MDAEPTIAAYEPPDQALELVAHSDSLITFANGSRAASAPVPGVAYRRPSPGLLLDFGLAYFRDNESPALANLLGVIDKMAKDEPGDVPEGSELVTAEEVPSRRLRQASKLD